jgi:hypothetical protein
MADAPRQSAIDRSFRQVRTLVRALMMTVLAGHLGPGLSVFYAAACLNFITDVTPWSRVLRVPVEGASLGSDV